MTPAEQFKELCFRQNAEFHGRKFIDALKSRDKKIIENHPVVQFLDKLVSGDVKAFHKKYKAGKIFYRSRKVNFSDIVENGIDISELGISAEFDANGIFYSHGYDEYNSKEAPIGIPPEGRANIAGMPYLYLAEEPYTACVEIRPEIQDVISLSEFELKKSVRVINFRDNDHTREFKELEDKLQVSPSVMLTWIMEQYPTSATEDVYLMTQFISDYIRKAGYDGVRFKSSMSGGTNITLFNSHKSIVKYRTSKLVFLSTKYFGIADFESGKLLKPVIKSGNLNQEELDKSRESIITTIKRCNKQNKGV